MTYKFGCGTNVIIAVTGIAGRPVHSECGTTFAGHTTLCHDCKEIAKSAYPQGWRYYPGDTCKHGVYVGGCGIDYMCHDCEMGY